MPQTLGIAGVFRKDQKAGGVFSVYRNLLRGINEVRLADEDYSHLGVTLFVGRGDPPSETDPFTKRLAPAPGNRFVSESLIGAIASRGFDAMLYPNYYLPPIRSAKRNIVILHDLQFRRFPELFSRRKRWWLDRSIRRTLNNADHVVTISAAVKQDVLQAYGGHLENRITPIWNPIDLSRFSGESTSNITGGRPYLLGVAIDRPQKNLATLVRAFAELRKQAPELRLVLAGQLRSEGNANRKWVSSSGTPSTVDLVKDLGLEDKVIVTGYVSDEQLGALYRGASLFVFPSLFEGFGMPPIEAMSLGAPTLVSDLPVLREVTQQQANYIADPLDSDALADQITELLSAGPAAAPPAELRNNLVQQFSPRAIAKQYLDVLLN